MIGSMDHFWLLNVSTKYFCKFQFWDWKNWNIGNPKHFDSGKHTKPDLFPHFQRRWLYNLSNIPIWGWTGDRQKLCFNKVARVKKYYRRRCILHLKNIWYSLYWRWMSQKRSDDSNLRGRRRKFLWNKTKKTNQVAWVSLPMYSNALPMQYS